MSFLKYVKDLSEAKASIGQKRSSKWRQVRNDFLKKNPRCALCDSKDKVEAHHIIPFNIAPDLELVESNLISLCESERHGVNCHLFFGHLGNYRRYNKNVMLDVELWRARIKNIIYIVK